MTKTQKNLTIYDAALKYVRERNTVEMFKLLDYLEDLKGGHPDHLPLICDINRCGHEGHRWAWDTLEDWQYQDA